VDAKATGEQRPVPPGARPGDGHADDSSLPADVAINGRPASTSLTQLAEEIERATSRLSRCTAMGAKLEARDEIEQCLQDLRAVSSSLRSVALCLDSALAECPADQREAFRAIVRSFGEKLRGATDANHAMVGRMNGQMKELDAIVELDPDEPVAPRLHSVLLSVREAASQISNRAQTLAAEVDSATEQLTSLEQQLDDAQRKALLDDLTGLQNRMGFEIALGDAISEGGTQGPWCLLLIDIDHFRTVNETHGRVVGDALLHKLARVVEQILAGAGRRAIACRYGGEEFGILIRGSTTQSAAALGEKIRESVSSSKWVVRGNTDLVFRATVSVAITEYQPADTIDSIARRAQTALSRAKAGGRNKVVVEHSALSAGLAARQASFRG